MSGLRDLKKPAGRARLRGRHPRESDAFPEFYAPEQAAKDRKPRRKARCRCPALGPISYKGQTELARDIANLRAACDAHGADGFMPAISPCDVVGNQVNEFYATEDEFLYAVADALNVEYRAIVDAGFDLQIDDPRLINYYVKSPQLSVQDCRTWAEHQVEAINHALTGIPEDRVRYHTCYGINMGPRVHDMEMKDYLDIVLKINAGAYSFEAANPRHEHEWKLWETVKLPDGKSIIPGVVTNSSVLVEHAELVAQRIERFSSVVGRENVIAGADCGFGTQASATPEVHRTIVWAKFQAISDGAKIASGRLWS
jgi:5-methyltetrahydropteroyltriglutamate--homocysteine methyltransferase